ncbi:hypothetical protein BGX28_000635, partial [Mortierella sp. GBA30]
ASLLGAQAASTTVSRPKNMFATVDKRSSANASRYRPRYAVKVRYEPTQQHEPPSAMLQYKLKPWNSPPDKPDAPELKAKKPPAPIKPQIHGKFERKEMLDAMMWEHPTVMLDLGDLKENVKAAVSDSDVSQLIVSTIQEAVREASSIKRKGQELIGKYIQAVFYPCLSPGEQRLKDPRAIANSTDISILDHLCPRLVSKEQGQDDEQDSSAEDGHGEGKKTHFLQTFLTFLYSDNMPLAPRSSSSGVAALVITFIHRLQDLKLLPRPDKPQVEIVKKSKDFTPSFLIRSVASQLSAELRRQYRHGCKKLSEKMTTMIKAGKLPSAAEIKLDNKKPAIELFLMLNSLTGNEWTIAPLSPVEDGYLTFTEIELGAFLHKKPELHPILKNLIQHTDKRVLTQEDLTKDWLRGQEPGLLIRRLVAPVAPDALPSKKNHKGVHTAPVKFLTPGGIRNHINGLRTPDFDPRAYSQKGYLLRGSIKTDGHQLQVLAFKLRELSSVRYKRYSSDLLPDRLLSTTAGIDDPLTEVRNVFKTKEDVERLLGCTGEQVASISYLGIDPGQACVVGAYAYLPPGKEPKRRHNRHRGRRKRGSRGRKPRGSGRGKRGKVKRDSRAECGERHINLAAKQKAVYQPTFKHRRWMEAQKAKAIAEELSIGKIETEYPPLHGENADFDSYVQHRQAYKDELDNFYNSNNFRFKRRKMYARAARKEEYYRLTDALLRMVGGSIGAKKKDEDKVVIGIGLGDFQSTSRLSSLDGTFMGYFIQKARSLGYLVVGVNEYYTSQKCPTCQKFIARPRNIRRSYCDHCRKYAHRDVMASHNMVNIMRARVERQERPDYLQPVDEDGLYPWKDGYKAEAQVPSASNESKGAVSKSSRERKRSAKSDDSEKESSAKKTKVKSTTVGGSRSARGKQAAKGGDDGLERSLKKMTIKITTVGGSGPVRGRKRPAKEEEDGNSQQLEEKTTVE